MANVAVLGLGAMGSRMAMNLLKAGHRVTVWNRDAERTTPLLTAGASSAATPHAAAAGADFVISMVRDDEASRQVWLDSANGALSGMSETAVAVESSTITVGWARALAKACEERQIAFVDAPVSGSRPQADAAQLIYFVGGDDGVVESVRPILMAMGSAVHHAGPAGSGAAIKLAVNALFGIQMAGLGELIGLVRRLGLDEAKAVEILSATPVFSPVAKAAAQAVLARNFAPMFPIDLVEKDLSYAHSTADETGIDVPLTRAALQVFSNAVTRGHGGDNITGVAQLYL